MNKTINLDLSNFIEYRNLENVKKYCNTLISKIIYETHNYK